MSATVDKWQDVIDSRDVIARIEELEAERDSFIEADAEAEGEYTAEEWARDWPDEAEELATLTALAEEASGYAADWEYGETLVRDSYFEDYAQELAEDCGMIPEGLSWPMTCIDWQRAARELKQDYTSVDFDGVEYWIR